MLHKTDHEPIRYARVCSKDGKEMAYEDIVKGYEYEDGEYIVISDADFAKICPKRSKSIDIATFTEDDQIDDRYFDAPYYLEPQKGAEKPYALLREALTKSKKIAIAKFIIRNREHLAAIVPIGKALVLNQMRFPEELREPSELSLPAKDLSTHAEVEMALKLIKQLTAPFAPEDFHDTYTDELEDMIEGRLKGHKPKVHHDEEPKEDTSDDLMASLKASLEHSKG